MSNQRRQSTKWEKIKRQRFQTDLSINNNINLINIAEQYKFDNIQKEPYTFRMPSSITIFVSFVPYVGMNVFYPLSRSKPEYMTFQIDTYCRADTQSSNLSQTFTLFNPTTARVRRRVRIKLIGFCNSMKPV